MLRRLFMGMLPAAMIAKRLPALPDNPPNTLATKSGRRIKNITAETIDITGFTQFQDDGWVQLTPPRLDSALQYAITQRDLHLPAYHESIKNII